MSYRTAPKGIAVLAAALAFGAPLTAFAHAYVMTPVSRDTGIADLNARAHKTGPCGGSPRIGSPTKFAPGAQVLVKWEETIQHQGCYQIRFSNNNDANFTLLNLSAGGVAQINDPANNAVPMVFQATVTLPTQKCPACTLQVTQIMKGAACTTPVQDPTGISTYFSCADICIGDAADPCTDAPKADAGADSGTDSGTTSSSGGVDSGSTSSSSGGGDDDDATTSSSSGASGATRRPTTSSDDGGCAVSSSSTPGSLSLAAVFGFVGFALVRRRRPR